MVFGWDVVPVQSSEKPDWIKDPWQSSYEGIKKGKVIAATGNIVEIYCVTGSTNLEVLHGELLWTWGEEKYSKAPLKG